MILISFQLLSIMLLLLMPSYASIFTLVLLSNAIASIVYFYKICTKLVLIKFSSVFNSSLLLSYFVGASNTLLRLYFEYDSYVLDVLYLPQIGTSIITAYILIASIMLNFYSIYEKSIFQDILFDVDNNVVVGFVFVCFVIVMGAFILGDVGFMGNINANNASYKVSEFGLVAVSLISPILAISIYSFNKSKNIKYKIHFLLIIICFLLLLLSQGRRLFFFSLVLSLIALVVSGSNFKNLSFQAILIGAMILILTIFAMKFFFAMRHAGYYLDGDVNLILQANEAFKIMGDEEISYKLSENALERTYILGYLTRIYESLSNKDCLNGNLFVFSFLLAIPSIFFDKQKLFAQSLGGIDDLVASNLGFSFSDEASSILTIGLADFGFLGLVMYPILLVCLFSFFSYLAEKFVKGMFLFFIRLSMVYSFLLIECDLTSYFVTLRNLFIYLLIYLFASVFFKFKNS